MGKPRSCASGGRIHVTELPRSSGVQLHITSLPDGRLGPRRTGSSTGWRPPGRRGGRCCRSVRPTDTARRTRRARRSRRGRACWPIRARRCPRRRSWRFAEREAVSGRVTGRGSPGGARWPTRSGSRASGARCGRTRPIAACGCSATWRSTWRRRAPTIAPIRSCSATGFVAGAPPDAYSRSGPALGQPAVRLAGAAPAAVPLVGRAAAADDVAVRPGADRPLPRVRVLLGGARRRARPPRRDAGSAGPGGRCSTRLCGRARVRSRWSPRTWA